MSVYLSNSLYKAWPFKISNPLLFLSLACMPIGCSLCLSVRMPIIASIGLKCFKDDFSFIMVLEPQENRHSTFFFFLVSLCPVFPALRR